MTIAERCAIPNRITVLEHVYYRVYGEEAAHTETGFTRKLEDSEQPFERRCKATPLWSPLAPNSWVEDAGMVIVFNAEGRFLDVNPSPEEIEEASKKVLEIRGEGDNLGWLIPPREGFRGTPTKLSTAFIRCLSGNASYTITVYPK